VLITLFYSTVGENWTQNYGWLDGRQCDWHGVDCSPFGYVVGINLTNNNLQGSLPPELALLAPAQILSGGRQLQDYSDRPAREDGGFRGGGGGGPPPPPLMDGEFGSLTPNITEGLLAVDLSMNNITGELPSRIGDCNNMEIFLVHDNQLSGPIPDISNWTTSLQEASFHSNDFVGEIPLEVCSIDDTLEERQISVDCDFISCVCCNPSCNYNSTATIERTNATATTVSYIFEP
jgi:hypothetical protein